ncbi:MAG: 4-hydroxy-tetrahydrodipicolinate synthase [Proteobacteria bacterium]|nr:4-hydroxy-tetrahydrodipicolinate synthase [Pseudomonadota bacterium]
MGRFEGLLTALVTPFRGGSVDEDALRSLVEAQIDAGVDGLVPCGTTGESTVLEQQEYVRVVRAAVEQAKGRVPVVAGAGSSSTGRTIELCKLARSAGADGVLLVVPYYNRPSQEGLVAHYRAVLRAVPRPAIIYNIPARTGADLEVASLRGLADVPEIVGIKEATGDVARAQDIIAACGDRFAVLSGDDLLTLAVLGVGGRGVISVSSNVAPALVLEVVRSFRQGDFAAAWRAHYRLLSLHKAMFVEGNPGPVKAALASMGRIAPELRLPLVWPREASLAEVRRALAELDLA